MCCPCLHILYSLSIHTFPFPMSCPSLRGSSLPLLPSPPVLCPLIWPARPTPFLIYCDEVYMKGEGSSNSCCIPCTLLASSPGSPSPLCFICVVLHSCKILCLNVGEESLGSFDHVQTLMTCTVPTVDMCSVDTSTALYCARHQCLHMIQATQALPLLP